MGREASNKPSMGKESGVDRIGREVRRRRSDKEEEERKKDTRFTFVAESEGTVCENGWIERRWKRME